MLTTKLLNTCAYVLSKSSQSLVLIPMQEHLLGDEYEKSQPSRKEKSLGLLCHKFLARYPDYPSPSQKSYICLDEVTEELRKLVFILLNVSSCRFANHLPFLSVQFFSIRFRMLPLFSNLFKLSFKLLISRAILLKCSVN